MNTIREATEKDISRIIELYEELTEEKINVPSEKIQQVFSEIIAIPNQHFLVAETNGYVSGTMFLQIMPNLSHQARPWAIIENMVTDSRYRRLGIGRLLIEHSLNLCKEADCYKVQLLSNKKRSDAHQFYRAMGFDESALGFRMYF